MLKKFYGDVLPESGHYALFLLGPKQHLWAESISDLVNLTEFRKDTQGVYFAVESFVEPTNRKADNVQALRSLRLDIDAGEKKHAKDPEGTYATQGDALAAALDFFRSTRIAPTYVVSSGEGLHIYYALDSDVDSTHWLPLAKRLGQLAKEQGLRVDSTVTSDTARILRPPGSLHPNGSRVTVLKDTGHKYAYAELKGLLGAEEAEPAITRKFNTSINDDVTAVEGPPKSAIKIAEHCPALREVAKVKGDVQEPLWRAMLGVVKFTTEGIDLAQEWSSGYDGYDPDEVDAKYEAWAAGPTSCSEFSRHSNECAKCEYAGKIKSPIVLGYLTPQQVEQLPEEQRPAPAAPPAPTGDPWDGMLPAGFEVKAIGGVRTLVNKMTVQKETDTGDVIDVVVAVPVTEDIFWLGQWAEAASSDDTAQVTMHRYNPKNGTVANFMMDQTLAADRYGLLKFLAGKGIVATHHKKAAQAMDDYIRASLQRIRGISQRIKVNDHFGMRILPGGDLACAHGKYLIRSDGTIEESMLGNALRSTEKLFPLPVEKNETGVWPKEAWEGIEFRAKQYVSFMKRSYGAKGLEKYQLAAMIGLASPIMAFVTGSFHAGSMLPPNGFTLSLYSRAGGRGKSALMQAIMTAYGDASGLSKDSGTDASTDIARIGLLSQWGTMPMSMDEMGSAKEGTFARIISAVANGAGRTRADKTGAVNMGPPFALINIAATNHAARDAVKMYQKESNAIQFRLMELNFDNIEFSQEAGDAYRDAYGVIQRDCSGALGAVIERELCRVGPAQLNADVMSCVNKAAQLLNAKQDARFQFRALGALLYLQLLLKRTGLDMFDTATLVGTFKEAHEAALEYIEENVMPTNGLDLTSMMLADLKANTLITETETTRGVSKDRYDTPLNLRIPDLVVARHVVAHGWTYISTHAMREWCTKNKVEERVLLADLKKADILIPQNPHKPNSHSWQTDLFKGTREEATAFCRCYKFDVRKLAEETGMELPVDDPKVTPITQRVESGSASARKEATHE